MSIAPLGRPALDGLFFLLGGDRFIVSCVFIGSRTLLVEIRLSFCILTAFRGSSTEYCSHLGVKKKDCVEIVE